jgi:tetratricopeptide (TPR) repeat protein
VYLWLAILLEAKGEREEALKIYDQGTEVNPMWDYLLQNKVSAIANSNNQEEAVRLQKELIEKAAYDPYFKGAGMHNFPGFIGHLIIKRKQCQPQKKEGIRVSLNFTGMEIIRYCKKKLTNITVN